MHHVRTTTIAPLLAAPLLTGCTAFGGDDPLPKPTGHTAPSASATPKTDGGTDDADRTQKTVTAEQAVAPGTVVAETDVVSPSGKTAVHVRVVANDRGTFDAQLSGYRTTNPQPMRLEFRHRPAKPLDGADGSVRETVEWDAAVAPPASFTMGQAGPRPDYLRSVVLVPATTADEDSSKRPWAGSVLAAADLTWKIPNPYPDLRVTVGKDRPGAYGIVTDVDGRPANYLVAHGDELSTVAERFGITPEQVQWMNPLMEPRDDDWLLEGSTLNIDPARR